MQSRIAERPTTAFTLSLVGFAVQIVAALVIMAAGFGVFEAYGRTGSMMGGMMGSYSGVGTGMMGAYSPWMMSGWGGFTWTWVPFLAVAIGIGAVGVFMMNSSEINTLRSGSILVLVGAVSAFPTVWGFIAGSLLMLVGGIMGLTWSPSVNKTS